MLTFIKNYLYKVRTYHTQYTTYDYNMILYADSIITITITIIIITIIIIIIIIIYY